MNPPHTVTSSVGLSAITVMRHRSVTQQDCKRPANAVPSMITSLHGTKDSAIEDETTEILDADNDDTDAVTCSNENENENENDDDDHNVSAASSEDENEDGDKDDDIIPFDAILRTRRTINSFEPDLPSNWEKDLREAIESAIYAPNHKRTEPWRFHLLGPKAIRRICELNAEIVAEKKGKEAGEKKLKRWLQMPGWVVVTCRSKIQSSGDNDGDAVSQVTMEDPAGLQREDYAACCCAVQNFCLSLHNAGMGTKWTTGPVNFDPRFNEIVGLENSDEMNEYVVGTIWFGTPATKSDPPKKKLPLDDVLIHHS